MLQHLVVLIYTSKDDFLVHPLCFPCSSLHHPLTSPRFSAAQAFNDISCPHINHVVAHSDTSFIQSESL